MTTEPEFDPFAGGELARTAPATDPQREIWVAVELGGDAANLAYNESTSLRIAGNIDESILIKAFVETTTRHEALRSTLSLDGTTICVETRLRTELDRLDLSGLDEVARQTRYASFHQAMVTTPFDLARGPLFRATLLKLADDSFELVLVAHHIVCDGWSFGVLLEEISNRYQAHHSGNNPGLPEAPRFTDYAAARVSAAHGEVASDTERYWVGLLGKQPPTLDLPTPRPRPRERTFAASRCDLQWSKELTDQLRHTGRKMGASFVATMLALFNTHLFRWTGQLDFIVGLAAAGQTDEGWGGLVGHCVNTLPVRVKLDPAAPFVDHARYAKTALLDAFEHQHASFGSLLQKLELPRDPSRVPLVPVLFNVDPRLPPLRLGEATGELFGNPRAYEAFEIFLNCTELEAGLRLELTYNTDLFDIATMNAWLEQLTALAQSVIADPNAALGALDCLSAAERDLQIHEWNQTAAPLPNLVTVIAAFEERAATTPDAIAVRDARTVLSYRELDERANHLARQMQRLGVSNESLVGICVERSARLVVALLAVWKAGAAYVPLDPDYPPSRLALIADDADLKVMLTERTLSDVLANRDIARIWIDEDLGSTPQRPPRTDDPHQLAYVLHTSGSTGKPKGVMIEHEALLNFLSSMQKEPGFAATDVLVAVTTLSFDIAGLELFLPLVSGGQTVVASREVAMDGKLLGQLLASSGATVFQATPATYRLLIDADFRGGERFTALCGGEALPRDLVAELRSRFGRVWNMYGPTETTIWSTCALLEEDAAAITIGRPIANTTAYVLDAVGEPVPIGSFGELYLGGLGVARGYLNRPELDAERFVVDRFSSVPGTRCYRTGDVVRYDRQGRLFYERRSDSQVKVRGFRIELGDIEAALANHPNVAATCAAVREFGPGDVRLVGYYCAPSGAQIPAGDLRTHLQHQLPPYMVPQHFVSLVALPLTPNGKVDRKALPMPVDDARNEERYSPPVTRVQQQLAEIWADLLRVHRVGIGDEFFELGGHSMLAARMLTRVRETVGVELPLRVAFQAQTIEALSAHIEAALLMRGAASRMVTGSLDEVDF